jgi:hypothetical protein
MPLTTKKYGVSVYFYPKLAIFGKTVGQHLWILSEILSFFKTCKNSNTWPLCLTDNEYGGHDQEIWSFGYFLAQTDNFR